MKRALVLWTVAFALLLIAFAITVASLNATVYSAQGFARSYLDALARHDATTASEMPGVSAPKGVPTDLLSASALGTITSIRHDSPDAVAGRIHDVAFSLRLNGAPATTHFRVEQSGAFLGLFPQWRFASSPLATVSVTVLHDTRFRVNGLPITSSASSAAASAPYVVFSPGAYVFDHVSTYLTASRVTVPITQPGSVTPVQVNVQANTAFVAQVNHELHGYLAQCATQQVLLPTACPFGKTFDNRVDSLPRWTISRYPSVTIVPGRSVGKWLVPTTGAAAHLKVKVQSLYDGSINTFDRDVPFDVSYAITVSADDQLTIREINAP